MTVPSKGPVAAALVLLALAVAGWLWFSPGSTRSNEADHAVSVPGTDTLAGKETIGTVDSPFAVTDISQQPTESGAGGSDVVDALPDPVDRTGMAASASAAASSRLPANALVGPVDVSQIALTPLGDEAFEALVLRLQADPALLQQLIDEFRQVQDPERRVRLARLLGQAGGPEVILAASELIYSGHAASRKLGLSLLQDVQPGSAEAREIASGLLATEVEPDVLVDTLTTLAKPGSVDDNSRAVLADQVALLSHHEDPGVRRISLDILSRWSTDGSDTPVLLDGLADSEYRVRESAAYALVGHEDTSQSVIGSLWSVALDNAEQESVRRAAILALRGMPIGDARLAELADVERGLDTVIRR